ncbi:hypothetical protein HMPREF9970_0108 [Lachnoanaerobaculum saburreum F0468]|jgi:hypothetical protein|uniref:Uncharacterized protein n=1 Tax=Lachnoanaerobaculum saburreum F0468 TaxID=1095750 RepID=I0R6V0_9FIRM|nr:hypothetical protein [Lachnoanaerobaculum saburreum]EIC95408.1 hypothetical protein HMPREF9970_0108 [Lachnoanaerobaculum saburreum F0468]DAS41873.1 MAG TPA: hypothetical protein [Caudoviricetes sp.]
MSLKEEFMKITTYEEWDTRREEFKSLNFRDRDIIDHLDSLYPKLIYSIGFENGIFTEVYPKPKGGEDPKKEMEIGYIPDCELCK